MVQYGDLGPYGYTVIPGLMVEKIFLSLLDFIGSLVKHQMTDLSVGLAIVVHSIDLFPMPVPHCFSYCRSIVSLKSQ